LFENLSYKINIDRRIPLLYKRGFKGEILSTEATKKYFFI